MKTFSCRTKSAVAFTLIELCIALFVLGMIVLVFGAMFPSAARAGHAGSNYAQATLLAQHKIDQLRTAGFSRLSLPSLSAMRVVDPAANADGSFSFTLVDGLVDNGTNRGFYAPGSTGRLTIGQALSGQGASAPAMITALLVTITIRWQGGNERSGSFTTHTIIAAP